MKKYKLSNGITIIFEKNQSSSVCVEVMVKTGSNDETAKEAGISHYLEHMLFEGTQKRANSREIANEIEKYGAEFNAYTTGDRTAYYIKIINKKFDKALEILSDMFLHSVFNEKIMEKEKKVILKEINMVTDDPRQHQWILLQQQLFSKHPAKNPTYGTKETVKNVSRKMLLDYYKKNYCANNIVISVVGNVSGVNKKIFKYFGALKKQKLSRMKRPKEPSQRKSKRYFEKRDIQNSYMILGYKTVSRLNKESYVLDVINGILGRGQSGWMFNEIRNKRGLAYQVGIHAEHEKDCGFFTVYCGLDKSKIPEAKKLIFEQFDKLNRLTKTELAEAKNYVEGNSTLQMEDNFQKADSLAYWETIKDAKISDKYIKNIRKVSLDDIRKVSKKYLNDKYVLVSIEQK
ncbi:insulinase family protein [Candidatus Woesearchaeota archaeon]|nr:insulinase family protein [Candidatus Woesearchaeota archaeon]